VLLYKFYVTRKEELDNCKYKFPPGFKTELEKNTPRGWGKVFGTEPLWNKPGAPDYGKSNLTSEARKWMEPLIGINVRESLKKSSHTDTISDTQPDSRIYVIQQLHVFMGNRIT
jgi:hypothetical protein